MQCQNLFSGGIKKSISTCRLLKNLPCELTVKKIDRSVTHFEKMVLYAMSHNF